jgi:hypothetical protein
MVENAMGMVRLEDGAVGMEAALIAAALRLEQGRILERLSSGSPRRRLAAKPLG